MRKTCCVLLAIVLATGCRMNVRREEGPVVESRNRVVRHWPKDEYRFIPLGGSSYSLERKFEDTEVVENRYQHAERWNGTWNPIWRMTGTGLAGALLGFAIGNSRGAPGDREKYQGTDEQYEAERARFEANRGSNERRGAQGGLQIGVSLPLLWDAFGGYSSKAKEAMQKEPIEERLLDDYVWKEQSSQLTVFRWEPARSCTVFLYSPSRAEVFRASADPGGNITIPVDLSGKDWASNTGSGDAAGFTLPAELATRLAQPASLSVQASYRDGDRPIVPTGALDATETAVVTAIVSNEGPGPAFDVRVTAESSMAQVGVTMVGGKNGPPWAEIPPGEAREIQWRLEAGRDLPDGKLVLTIAVTEGRGYDPAPLKLVVAARRLVPPRLVVAGARLLDGVAGWARGNGDGKAQSGEEVEVLATVRNDGEGQASGVRVSLSTAATGVTVTRTDAGPFEILPGAEVQARFGLSLARGFSSSDGALAVSVTATDVREVGQGQATFRFGAEAIRPELLVRMDFADQGGNSSIENGDELRVSVSLKNRGRLPAQAVVIRASAGAGVVLSPAEARIPLIAPEASSETLRFAGRVPLDYARPEIIVALAIEQQDFPAGTQEQRVAVRLVRPELALEYRLLNAAGAQVPALRKGERGVIEVVAHNRGGLAAGTVTIDLALAQGLVRDTDRASPADLGTVPAGGSSRPARFPFMVQGRAGTGPLQGTLRVAQAAPFPGAGEDLAGLSVVEREAIVQEVQVGPEVAAGPGAPRPGGSTAGGGAAGAAGSGFSALEVIVFEPNLSDGKTLETIEESIRLSALARDPVGIRSWSVWRNGVEIPEDELRGVAGVAEAPASSAGRTERRIDRIVPLIEGLNTIELEAANIDGQVRHSRPIQVLRRKVTGTVHVLVIGINDYDDPGIGDLRYAESDARRVYEFFSGNAASPAQPEHCTLLLGRQASMRSIRRAIDRAFVRPATEADSVILYYSGHGDSDETGEEYYLIPQDAERGSFASTAIELSDIQRLWNRVRARTKVFLADSCNAGGFSGLRTARGQDFADALGEGKVCLLASAPGEKALESESLGGGIFTHFLLAGLSGEADGYRGLDPRGRPIPASPTGRVSVADLKRYLADKVPAAARQQNHQQTPHVVDYSAGDVYLTRRRE